MGFEFGRLLSKGADVSLLTHLRVIVLTRFDERGEIIDVGYGVVGGQDLAEQGFEVKPLVVGVSQATVIKVEAVDIKRRSHRRRLDRGFKKQRLPTSKEPRGLQTNLTER